jgi:glutamate-1-semialdehyde 2,1-aminomutase
MTGHALPAVVNAVGQRASAGSTAILPTEDSIWAAKELSQRFGLSKWQVAMTATDANRAALRIARHITERPRILVFNWCYHGTLEETMVVLEGERVVRRRGVVGPGGTPANTTTRVVEFNDISGLEQALAHGDVACVLAEPALTNVGIVLPQPGFHDELRRLTKKAGSLLVLDETHTLCAGPGGMTRRDGLEPDMLVLGKAIGGGVPVAAFGVSEEIAGQASAVIREPGMNITGVGGTLTGNAVAVNAMRTTLECALRPEDYARSIPLAVEWANGVSTEIKRFDLDWSVTQLGCRAEYSFAPASANAAVRAEAGDERLETLLHLYLLNRGVLITPFHNMALMCAATSSEDVRLHTRIFRDCLDAVFA